MQVANNLKIRLFIIFVFTSLFGLYGQTIKDRPFFSETVQGDFTMIGNNSMSIKGPVKEFGYDWLGRYRHTGKYYDARGNVVKRPYDFRPNENINTSVLHNGNGIGMGFIDIDEDSSTFQSSMAKLVYPSTPEYKGCVRVKKAYLYWSSHADNISESQAKKVKIKLPGENEYRQLEADEYNFERTYNHYFCRKDVTDLLNNLEKNGISKTAEGEYIVADIYGNVNYNIDNYYYASVVSGGWSLVVVYEDPDPSKLAKVITFYDGIQKVGPEKSLKRTLTGFKTIPKGPVRAKVGMIAIEGDVAIEGDYFSINGRKIGGTSGVNKSDNFFDASISIDNRYVTDREPASENTIGWDVDIVTVNNPSNSVIANGATSLRIESGTTGDVYNIGFVGFSIETVAPSIQIGKSVMDESGTVNITNQSIERGKKLRYEISFQNTGNEDVLEDATLVDILPDNSVYNGYIDTLKAPDVTYNVDDYTDQNTGRVRTRVTFKIPKKYLKKGGDKYTVSISVSATNQCSELSDLCANAVKNQAEATYTSVFVPNPDPKKSYIELAKSSVCSREEGYSTVYINVKGCDSAKDVILCGTDGAELVAGQGFESYKWYAYNKKDEILNDKPGYKTDKAWVLKVLKPGTYVVEKVIPKTAETEACYQGLTNKVIKEIFEVKFFGQETGQNPLKEYATETYKCKEDGKEYAQIYLCGDETKQFNLSQGLATPAKNIIWWKYKGTPNADEKCPTRKTGANAGEWEKVGEGFNYNLKDADPTGTEYALDVQFENGGTTCNMLYYFRAFKSSYSFNVEVKDQYCNNRGMLILKNIPSRGTFKYVVKDESGNSISNSQVPAGQTYVNVEITNPGVYEAFIIPILKGDKEVCKYPAEEGAVSIKSLDIKDLIDIQSDKVKCAGGTADVKISVDRGMPAPFTINILRKGETGGNQPLETFQVQNEDSARTKIYKLVSGDYVLKLTSPEGNGNCNNIEKEFHVDKVPDIDFNVLSDVISCGGDKSLTLVVKGGQVSATEDYGIAVIKKTGGVRIDPNKVKITKERTEKQVNGDVQMTYSVVWNDGDTNLDYIVKVIDANNCEKDKDVKLKNMTRPDFDFVAEPSDCQPNSGRVTYTLKPNPVDVLNSYEIVYFVRKETENGSGKYGPWVGLDQDRAGLKQKVDTATGGQDAGSSVIGNLSPGKYQTRMQFKVGNNGCYIPSEEDDSYITEDGKLVVTPKTPREFVITEGNGPLKAFVGVKKLPCKVGNQIQKGIIRVVNVTGGRPFENGTNKYYEYKYPDTGWVRENTHEMEPGTYTVLVRDNKCGELSLQVVMPKPIEAPKMDQPEVKYDCDGKGIVSFSMKNETTGTNAYEFSFEQDVPAGQEPSSGSWTTNLNNTINKVYDPGIANIDIYYRLKESPSPNIILEEDFGVGSDIGISDVPSVYKLGRSDVALADGYYIVTSKMKRLHDGWGGNQNSPEDIVRTGGRFLAMNIGDVAGIGGVIYQKTVRDVEPNQPIKFSMSLMNLLVEGKAGDDPDIEIRLVDGSGNTIDSKNYGKVKKRKGGTDGKRDWTTFDSGKNNMLNPGNNTTFTIQIRTNTIATNGNDLAIDNIRVYQEPETCLDKIPFRISIEDNKKFRFKGAPIALDSKCSGEAQGDIVASVENFNVKGYSYRLVKDGQQFLPMASAGTVSFSPVRQDEKMHFERLPKGTYYIEVKTLSSIDNVTECPVVRSPDLIIEEPDPITVDIGPAGLTSYINCNQSSINVSIEDHITVSGGTPPYAYVVTDLDHPGSQPIIPVLQDGQPIFSVATPSRYSVKIKDANGCSARGVENSTINVVKRTPAIMNVSVECTMTDGGYATVTVREPKKENNEAGWEGRDPNGGYVYTYSIKVGPRSEDRVFTENTNTQKNLFILPGGTYTIRATDQYGCYSEQEITINKFFTQVIPTIKNPSTCNGTDKAGYIEMKGIEGGTGDYRNYEFFLRKEGEPAPVDTDISNVEYTVDTSADPSDSSRYIYRLKVPYDGTKDQQSFTIYVRDVSRKDCSFILGTAAVVYEKSPKAIVEKTDPVCDGGEGEIVVKITEGTAPYSVAIFDATGKPNSFVPTISTPGYIELYKESNSTIYKKGVPPGDYYVVVVSGRENDNQCPAAMNVHRVTVKVPEFKGKVVDVFKQGGDPCNPRLTDLGFRFEKIYLDGEDPLFTYLYSIDNGKTWSNQTEYYATNTTEVHPVIGRFPKGTQPGANLGPLCKKDLGKYIFKKSGGVEIDYASVSANKCATGECTIDYKLPVMMTDKNAYIAVQYALDTPSDSHYDNPNAEWHDGDQANVKPWFYEFTQGKGGYKLVAGREYTVYVRYKTINDPDKWCYTSVNVDLEQPNIPKPSLEFNTNVIAPCFGETKGKIEFTIKENGKRQGDSQLKFVLKKINSKTGVIEELPKPYDVDDQVANGQGDLILREADGFVKTITLKNIEPSTTAGEFDKYFIEVTDSNPVGGTGCVSGTKSVAMNQGQSTAELKLEITKMPESLDCKNTDKEILATATGGSGFGYTFVIKRKAADASDPLKGNQYLLRNIKGVSTGRQAAVFNISKADFNEASIRDKNYVKLEVTVTDSNGCSATQERFLTFAPPPKVSVTLIEDCWWDVKKQAGDMGASAYKAKVTIVNTYNSVIYAIGLKEKAINDPTKLDPIYNAHVNTLKNETIENIASELREGRLPVPTGVSMASKADVSRYEYSTKKGIEGTFVDFEKDNTSAEPQYTPKPIIIQQGFKYSDLVIRNKETKCATVYSRQGVDPNEPVAYSVFEASIENYLNPRCTKYDTGFNGIIAEEGEGIVTISAPSGSGEYVYSIEKEDPASPTGWTLLPPCIKVFDESTYEIDDYARATQGFFGTGLNVVSLVNPAGKYRVTVVDAKRLDLLRDNALMEEGNKPAGSEALDCFVKKVVLEFTEAKVPIIKANNPDVPSCSGSLGSVVVTMDLSKPENQQGPYVFELWKDSGNNGNKADDDRVGDPGHTEIKQVGNNLQVTITNIIGYRNEPLYVKAISSRGCEGTTTMFNIEPAPTPITGTVRFDYDPNKFDGTQGGFSCDHVDGKGNPTGAIKFKATGGKPFRTEDGYDYYAFSIDGGHSWVNFPDNISFHPDGRTNLLANQIKDYAVISDIGITQTYNWVIMDGNGCMLLSSEYSSVNKPIVTETRPAELSTKVLVTDPLTCSHGATLVPVVERTLPMPVGTKTRAYVEFNGNIMRDPAGDVKYYEGEVEKVELNYDRGYVSYLMYIKPIQTSFYAQNPSAIVGEYKVYVIDPQTHCELKSKPFHVLPPSYPTMTVISSPICSEDSAVRFKLDVSGIGGYGAQYQLIHVIQKTTQTDIVRNFDRTTGQSGISEFVTDKNAVPTGIYTFEIKSLETGCTASADVEVSQPSKPVTATIQLTKKPRVDCTRNLVDTGTIALVSQVVGGWGPEYRFRLKKDDELIPGMEDFTNQTVYGGIKFNEAYPDTPISYVLEIMDSRGCISRSNVVVVKADDQLRWDANNVTSKAVTCYGGSDGEIEIKQVEGGSGEYIFTLFSYDNIARRDVALLTTVKAPTGVRDVKFDNLAAGHYRVLVQDPEVECSSNMVEVEVKGPEPVKPVAIISRYPSCDQGGNIKPGSIKVSVTGGSAIYVRYQMVDPATNEEIAGTEKAVDQFDVDPMVDKTYKFKVTDDKGCVGYSNELFIPKYEPVEIKIEDYTKVIKCSGDEAGSITATATKGVVESNYEFRLLKEDGTEVNGVLPSYTGKFDYLPAGKYKVSVGKGDCLPVAVSEVVEIKEETPYKVKVVKTDVTCNGLYNGKIDVVVTEGDNLLDGTKRKFKYAISDRLDRFVDNGGKFDKLKPGLYYILMMDENGCRPTEITYESDGTKSGAGVIEVSISEPNVFAATVIPGSMIHEGCIGEGNGELRLSITGGKPFVDPTTGAQYYKVSKYNDPDPNGFVPYDVTVGLKNVPIGFNKVWVMDSGGCSLVEVDLGESLPGVDIMLGHEFKYVCSEGTNNMIARVTVTVNENPDVKSNIVYYLDPVLDATGRILSPRATNHPIFFLPAVAPGAPSQTHNILVVNRTARHFDCQRTITVKVDPVEGLKWIGENATHVKCFGGTEGVVEITDIVGGSYNPNDPTTTKSNYRYKIQDQTDWQESNKFENLESGFYIFKVKDLDTECEIEKEIEITEPKAIDIVDLKTTGITCTGATTGGIDYQVKGGTKSYKVEIRDENGNVLNQFSSNIVEGTQKIRGMEPGKYKLVVTDTNVCQAIEDFEIEGIPDLDPVSIDVYYDCPVSSGNVTQSRYAIYVKLNTTLLGIDSLFYTLDGEADTNKKPFNRFDSNDVAVIEGVTLAEGQHKMKLFYKDCTQESTKTFEITNYGQLTITDKTENNSINVVKVGVTGGKAPYKVYFTSPKYESQTDLKNNSYKEYLDHDPSKGDLEYVVQKGNVGNLDPANGKEVKVVRVYAEDAVGCYYYIDVQKEFMDIIVPNYFTPNGDGDGDYWHPENMESYPNATIDVFDRYGRLIVKLKYNEKWDGLYEGKELPTGDYWYVIKLNEPNDSRTFEGHFTLYR